MKKILQLSLCLLLASSVQAQENLQPTTTALVQKVAEQAGQEGQPPAPPIAPKPDPASELTNQTSILPPVPDAPVIREPKPIKPTKVKDSTAAFDEPVPVNFIAAEMPTIVQLSNRDINRIVCSGPMSDLIFSEEKGVTGHFSGNSAFIKFKAKRSTGNYPMPRHPASCLSSAMGPSIP